MLIVACSVREKKEEKEHQSTKSSQLINKMATSSLPVYVHATGDSVSFIIFKSSNRKEICKP